MVLVWLFFGALIVQFALAKFTADDAHSRGHNETEPVIESVTCEAAGFGDSVYKLQSPTKRSFGRRVLECSGY
ncbi:hypothetical protein PN419_17980, partial [Halorubrum ezzemoulense]